MFVTNKTTILTAEDDDGYRSASPTSQTAQSAACVILWGEWMFWQFSFLCYPFQIPSQFKQNMLFFSRKHHSQRCKRLVLFHITWSLGKVSICDIFTMHTRKKEFSEITDICIRPRKKHITFFVDNLGLAFPDKK